MNYRDTMVRLSDQMAVPDLMGSRIEINGTHQLLLCGHKGIRVYSQTEIIVELRDCAARIQGSDLGIASMTKTELLLRGAVDSVSFLR